MMGEAGTAVLFPGQGSQHDRMREPVGTYIPDLAEFVCELLGDDPFRRLDEGTRWVQPAVFLTSLASWHENQITANAVVMAGHSLGEFAALVAAGALDAQQGARLVVQRGAITEEVANEVGGGMLALLGVDNDQGSQLASTLGLHVANDNCPGQIVLSGSEAEIGAAKDMAEDLGVAARRLAVDGPFHSPLMKPAMARFAGCLDEVEFSAPNVPVISCTTAKPFDEPRRRLAEALIRPVRWRETTEALNSLGAKHFLEVAPGKVLSGLVRRCLRAERPSVVTADRYR